MSGDERTKTVRCSHTLEGPPINGAGTVAWRRTCRNRVRIPADQSAYGARCWQHAPADIRNQRWRERHTYGA